MRTIKFRQPVTKQGKFYDWHYWGYLEDGNLGFFTTPLSSNDGEIMESYQFTGLKDKNGKEIYEGDLLVFADRDIKNFVVHEIFYHDNDSADNHIGFQMNRVHWQGNLCGGFVGHRFLPKTTKLMAVIGNIYENPELIK